MTLLEDLAFTWNIYKIKAYSKKIINMRNWSVSHLFNKLLLNGSDKKIYIDKGSISYYQLDINSNKIGNWALGKGLKKGDTVPLIMNNSINYISIWLGLAKIGVTTVLINTNLTGKSLQHCIDLGFQQSKNNNQNKIILMDKDYQSLVTSLYLEKTHQYYVFGSSDTEIENDICNSSPTLDIDKTITYNDALFFIFTSGTTGMPKAAKISHLRFAVAGYAFKKIYKLRTNDRLYIPLPLYHSNGGMVGISSSWQAGTDIVLREKFSSSKYFQDCTEYNCTVGVYIGECCRYILATPESAYDKIHPVRLLMGNGLRPEVWKLFIERFNVQIGEFYGSTEGNANLFNPDGKPGAVGYLPWCLRAIYPVKFIKYNTEDENHIIDNKGYYIECELGEEGEAIGLINDKDATRKFDGYTDKSATKKKILSNVFTRGDKWFRTGDILKLDKDGYVYFMDRIGDTFRWKGENVSTSEVGSCIEKDQNISDCIVYGAKLEKYDGRIGMAAIKTENQLDFKLLYNNIVENLPVYAQPYFIRLLSNVEMTGTFKYKKNTLKSDGIYVNSEYRDPIYIKSDKNKTFELLSEDNYRNITEGKFKF